MATMDLETVPRRATFPVGLVMQLWINHHCRNYQGDVRQLQSKVLRRIYRRIENGKIRAIQLGLGEPLLIERPEVVRILTGEIE
jgi:hypothetical protein